MPLDKTFGMVVLAFSTISWPRWVEKGEGGGVPRLAFGVKNAMVTIRDMDMIVNEFFGAIFGSHISEEIKRLRAALMGTAVTTLDSLTHLATPGEAERCLTRAD